MNKNMETHQNNNSPKNFVLISYQKGSNYQKVIDRLETKLYNRFYAKLRQVNSNTDNYLRVSYGKHEDICGKKTEFWNDGHYGNKQDLMLAFRTFCEK